MYYGNPAMNMNHFPAGPVTGDDLEAREQERAAAALAAALEAKHRRMPAGLDQQGRHETRGLPSDTSTDDLLHEAWEAWCWIACLVLCAAGLGLCIGWLANGPFHTWLLSTT